MSLAFSTFPHTYLALVWQDTISLHRFIPRYFMGFLFGAIVNGSFLVILLDN